MDIARIHILDREKLLRKHNVQGYEVLEVFRGGPRIQFSQRGDYQGEDVYVAFGQTEEGR